MAYTIYKSDGTPVTIPDGAIDTAYYNPNANAAGVGVGIQLAGRQAFNYGAPIAQNFLQLTENFAGPNLPSDSFALQGQLWFNTTTEAMYVRVTNATSGGIANWEQIATFTNFPATSSNLGGGTANSIPYQTGPGTTAFLAQGTGVLQETAGAPVWTTSPTIYGTNFSAVPNSALTNSSITVTAGTGLSGGGSVSLGSSVTLNNAGITSITSGGGVVINGSSTFPVTYTGDITISLPAIVSTDTLQTVTNNGSTTTNTVAITNSTASISASSGALVVNGGVGVGGNINSNGVITGGSFNGPGTGLTGTASSLTAGTATIANTLSPAATITSSQISGGLGFTPAAVDGSNITGTPTFPINISGTASVTSSQIVSAIGFLPPNPTNGAAATGGLAANGTWPIDITGNANTVTSITSVQVTTALTYTPVDSTGTGATGTWPISITGSSATVASIAGNSLTSAQVTGGLGYTPISLGGTTDSAGTMTGPLILSGDPTVALGAATKQYVDTAVGVVQSNAQTAAYTLALTDIGKSIDITTGGITVPSHSAVAFNVGDIVSIFNNSTSNQSITPAAGVTMHLAGTATVGTRTLAQYGVATLRNVGTDIWVIVGAGLT